MTPHWSRHQQRGLFISYINIEWSENANDKTPKKTQKNNNNKTQNKQQQKQEVPCILDVFVLQNARTSYTTVTGGFEKDIVNAWTHI